MILFKKGFEKQYNDVIVVIYELGENGKKAVKIDTNLDAYFLREDKEYFILCRDKEFHIRHKNIDITYDSHR